MTQRLHLHGLDVDRELAELVALEIAPGTGIDPDHFWSSFARTLNELTPKNKQLLKHRDVLAGQIDRYYVERRQEQQDVCAVEPLRALLSSIGYLAEQVKPTVMLDSMDAELALVAGPQLVVPVINARYALNAANARWGSLYDAVYGSDLIPELDGVQVSGPYNPLRGQQVVELVSQYLDEIIPLAEGKHAQVTEYGLVEAQNQLELHISLDNGNMTKLQDPSAFRGHHQQQVLLFCHHGLYLELHIDSSSTIGQHHSAGLKDVVLEAALTTIQDCEDSVAAVDASDKVCVYRNWLGLMQGNLEEKFEKNGKVVRRKLAEDRFYTAIDGTSITLSGRSLMLVRNVGLHMTTDAVRKDGEPIYEGILDGFITCFAALHDLRRLSPVVNSKAGNIYIVKPKLHGPDEVAFVNTLFNTIETCLELDPNTIKLGIMDEERRTTVNLGACLEQAKHRVAFINTGFLDRTGDEIHTCMEAGPVVPKSQMKQMTWINAYERWNVAQGLAAGLRGQAQIGKGMWAKPDEMAGMMSSKAEQLEAGANCAWVPSPTAAVLHAIHYHRVNVIQVQESLSQQSMPDLTELLTIPVGNAPQWSKSTIVQELENNCQGILAMWYAGFNLASAAQKS